MHFEIILLQYDIIKIFQHCNGPSISDSKKWKKKRLKKKKKRNKGRKEGRNKGVPLLDELTFTH